MSHALVRRTVAGGAAFAALATVTLAVAAPAHAALPPATNGKISYNRWATTYAANVDGSGLTALQYSTKGSSWSPDGSRYVTASTSPNPGLVALRADGGVYPTQLTNDATDSTPVWSAYGQEIYFSRGGKLRWVSSDGSGWNGDLGENSDTSKQLDLNPAVSPRNDLVFERDDPTNITAPAIYSYDFSSRSNPKLLVQNAAHPTFSPDGKKIAYELVGTATQIWVVDFDGATQTVSNPRKLIDDSAGARDPAWSPDGASVLYTQGSNTAGTPITLFDVTTGTSTPVTSSGYAILGYAVSWQPIRKNSLYRVWGQNAVGTAIAASQWNYRDNGNTGDTVRSQANAVVLSRADAFYDALAGSALAINKQAPLLITYPSGLDANVQAEIKRVLGTSGTVYLLGGTAALPVAIESKLTSLGYTVKRLAGATAIETAIEIDKQITTSTPATTIVATASEFYDALAAGAAAGANPGTTIVLTWGDYMPAASASYLNALKPDLNGTGGGVNGNGGTAIVAAGGPGDRALKSANLSSWPASAQYFSLVGANAKDTALLLAKFFFSTPTVAAVATSAGWYDALTGGAMIGAAGGPLLLTDPSGLYRPVTDYLSYNAGSLWDGVILGGTAALPDTLQERIGDAISLPWQWTYIDYQPTTGTPSARGMTAQSGSTTSRVTAGDRQAATTPPGISRTAATTLTR